MKRLLLLLFIFALAGDFNKSFSWDSTAAKYLPLQVGNVWVYSFNYLAPIGYGVGFDRYRLTGTQLINSHLFFTVQHTRVQIGGTYFCPSRLFWQNFPIRIDSFSCNIYTSSCMVDSLKSKISDTALVCGGYHGPRSVCNDTALYNIFGFNRESKNFMIQGFEGVNNQRYVKNIGLVKYSYTLQMSTCNQTLKGCIINGVLYGDTSLTGLLQISSEVPEQFSLFQNYPNPFNPSTKIKFQIPKSGLVKLTVFDVLGKEIQVLVNQELAQGTYEADFDGSNLPSGVYYYKMETDDFVETKKMVLLK